MTTNQQIRLAELVEGIRRRQTREANPTNLVWNEPIRTNHANKLNRDAAYVQENLLDAPRGTGLLPESIEYGGYRRQIIYRNPLLVDEEGELVEDEDEMHEEYVEPIEENPYQDVKLEDILRPLTAASELPNHPRMSRPYLEPGLPEMIRNAEESLHREQTILWTMKELFVRFRGDSDWVPVGDLRTGFDDWLKATVFDSTPLAETSDNATNLAVNGTSEGIPTNGSSETMAEEEHTADGQLRQEAAANGNGNQLTNGHVSEHGGELMQIDETSDPQTESGSIHPIFLAPPGPPPDPFTNQNPDLDPLGPLHAYISKQEEIVRLVKELHSGLLKALRMRREVYGWAKAEGHVGEMSDGEDWVDLEEWGLEPGDLVKGKEEDDNGDGGNGDAVTASRRGRRRVGEGR